MSSLTKRRGIIVALEDSMKTTIVCGLLGSGKTTFIRNYLRDRTEKTVVLVNDFGQAGIDGEIFSAAVSSQSSFRAAASAARSNSI